MCISNRLESIRLCDLYQKCVFDARNAGNTFVGIQNPAGIQVYGESVS